MNKIPTMALVPPIFKYTLSTDPCELEVERSPWITFHDYLEYKDKHSLELQKVSVMGPTLDDLLKNTKNGLSVFRINQVWDDLLGKDVVKAEAKAYTYSKLSREVDQVIRTLADRSGMKFSLTTFRGEFVLKSLGELNPSENLCGRFISQVLEPASEELAKQFRDSTFQERLRDVPKWQEKPKLTRAESLQLEMKRIRALQALEREKKKEKTNAAVGPKKGIQSSREPSYKMYDMINNNREFIRIILGGLDPDIIVKEALVANYSSDSFKAMNKNVNSNESLSISKNFIQPLLALREGFEKLEGGGVRVKALDVEKLFAYSEQGQKTLSRFLVTGAAGTGKSTLCQYLANTWAEHPEKLGKWKVNFEYLFLIRLQDLASYQSIPTLAEVMKKSLPGPSLDSIERILSTSSDKILFLLDGYDEVASWLSPEERNAFFRVLLRQPHWLLTASPDSFKDPTGSSNYLELKIVE